MTIPYPLLGIVALIIALYLGIAAPPGQRSTSAIASALLISICCVFASFALWPIDPKNEWNWIAPGLVLAMVLIILRDMRRWSRHFRNNSYRRYHPYHWYGRVRNRRW